MRDRERQTETPTARDSETKKKSVVRERHTQSEKEIRKREIWEVE